MPACKRRLTPAKAIEIYAQKVLFMTSRSYSACFTESIEYDLLKGKSAQVGRRYNVSAKTIRDVWNHRSWTAATCGLWELAIIPPKSIKQPPVHKTEPVIITITTPPQPDDWLHYRDAWEPLPIHSNENDDPFHDDWQHW